MPVLQVDDDMARRVSHGQPLGPAGGEGRVAITDGAGEVLAVYEARSGELCAAKVLTGA